MAALCLIGLDAVGAVSAGAAAPGSMEVTCDVDRTQFRNAAKTLSSPTDVTFRIWADQAPGAPDTQVGSDYTVPLSALNVVKRYTDRYDGVKPRKTERIQAAIGSDGSPVVLPVDGIAYLDLTVGSTTLGCDHGATSSATLRRRLESVAFAREATHSTTCETCTIAQDVSVRVYKTSNFSTNSWASAAITFDSVRWDTHGMFSIGTPTKLCVPVAGKYYVFGHASWDGNALGQRSLEIKLNGTTEIAIVGMPGSATVGENDQQVSTHYQMAAGDCVELVAFQTSGTGLEVRTDANFSPEFGLVKLP